MARAPSCRRNSAARCLTTLASGATPCLVAVPSQLLLMLQWAEHRHIAPIPEVELITISGARWMRDHTPALRKLFPKARIIEFYGASEASFVAWMEADEASSPQAVGRPFSNVEIDIRPTADPCIAQAGAAHAEDGLIYIRSPMLFMDYVGDAHDPTAVLRDGDWLSVRDMGHIDERGMLCLAGRQSRMLVTQGKNLFPEEVENLLASHPAIAQVSLHGQVDAARHASPGRAAVAARYPATRCTATGPMAARTHRGVQSASPVVDMQCLAANRERQDRSRPHWQSPAANAKHRQQHRRPTSASAMAQLKTRPSGVPILAWTRSPVAPVGGALSQLACHELGAPLLQALLAQTGLPPQAIDAVVLGNALGAGGNPPACWLWLQACPTVARPTASIPNAAPAWMPWPWPWVCCSPARRRW